MSPESLNFCFPARDLANERIKLTPFRADRHAQQLFQLTAKHPELYAHGPSGPYASLDDFVTKFLEETSQANPGMVTFAIIDKTQAPSLEDGEGALAGRLSFMNSSPTDLATEIGHVLIIPQYQRTHVTTNAVGLMLQYALSSIADGGLGLRRVQWQASAQNKASIRVAERMGFQYEGLRRWDKLFKQGRLHHKVGNNRELPDGSDPDDLWRDTVTLGHCWDTWADGGRAAVEAAMARRPPSKSEV